MHERAPRLFCFQNLAADTIGTIKLHTSVGTHPSLTRWVGLLFFSGFLSEGLFVQPDGRRSHRRRSFVIFHQLVDFLLQHFTECFDIEGLLGILMPDQFDPQRIMKILHRENMDVFVRVALGVVFVNP